MDKGECSLKTNPKLPNIKPVYYFLCCFIQILADLFGFAAIHSHGNFLFHVDFEQVFECVIVLVQPGLPYGDDKVEEGLEASVTARAVVLNSEDVIALGSSSGDLNTLAASHCHSSDQWLTDRVSLAKAVARLRASGRKKKINKKSSSATSAEKILTVEARVKFGLEYHVADIS